MRGFDTSPLPGFFTLVLPAGARTQLRVRTAEGYYESASSAVLSFERLSGLEAVEIRVVYDGPEDVHLGVSFSTRRPDEVTGFRRTETRTNNTDRNTSATSPDQDETRPVSFIPIPFFRQTASTGIQEVASTPGTLNVGLVTTEEANVPNNAMVFVPTSAGQTHTFYAGLPADFDADTENIQLHLQIPDGAPDDLQILFTQQSTNDNGTPLDLTDDFDQFPGASLVSAHRDGSFVIDVVTSDPAVESLGIQFVAPDENGQLRPFNTGSETLNVGAVPMEAPTTENDTLVLQNAVINGLYQEHILFADLPPDLDKNQNLKFTLTVPAVGGVTITQTQRLPNGTSMVVSQTRFEEGRSTFVVERDPRADAVGVIFEKPVDNNANQLEPYPIPTGSLNVVGFTSDADDTDTFHPFSNIAPEFQEDRAPSDFELVNDLHPILSSLYNSLTPAQRGGIDLGLLGSVSVWKGIVMLESAAQSFDPWT
ncbi:hypothetical protein BVX98_02160, partial [bacterium F11]